MDNPHAKSQNRARSSSLNPNVYPSWWGDENEIDPAYYHHRRNIPKRLKSADPLKAKINRNVARHAEDNLDKRLRQVHEDSNRNLNGSF